MIARDERKPGSALSIEPYSAKVDLRGGAATADLAGRLELLLEDIARGCEAAGASVIGHIKCVLRTNAGLSRCSVTSVLGGARCAGDGPGRLERDEEAELRLAVLVYGLPATTIDHLVEDSLERVFSVIGVGWAKGAVSSGSARES